MATPSKKETVKRKGTEKKEAVKKSDKSSASGAKIKRSPAKSKRPNQKTSATASIKLDDIQLSAKGKVSDNVIRPDSISQSQSIDDVNFKKSETLINERSEVAEGEIISKGSLKSEDAKLTGASSNSVTVGTVVERETVGKITPLTGGNIEEGESQSARISTTDRARNKPKTNRSYDLDFSEFLENVEEKLLQVDKLSAENDNEGISLFAGRCSCRVLSLAVKDILSNPRRLDKNKSTNQILVLWRAALVAWSYQLDQSKTSSAAKAANALCEEVKESMAVNAIASASMYTANFSSEDGPISLALNSYNSSAAAVAESIVITQAIHEDPSDDAQSAYEIVFDAGNLDLQWMLDPENNLGDLRRKPLWHEQVISESGWQSELESLIKEINEDELSESSIALKKMIVDYDAILKGVWGKSLDSPIQEVAVKKTQQDLPSAIDHLGRDQLVNALLSRLSVKDDKNHLTIGLLGDWGIGKSSVIEQLREKLDEVEHCDYVFGEFNAWSYEHTQNLQAGIAHEVISALTTTQSRKFGSGLPSGKRWGWCRRLTYKPYVVWKFAISLYGERMLFILCSILAALFLGAIPAITNLIVSNPAIAGAGSLAVAWLVYEQLKVISSQPLAKELKTYLRLPSYQEHLGTIPMMQNNIKAIAEICLGEKRWDKNRRLVFFVDDLDRCGVDGIVKTFEAVRLVLGLDWVTVIIAMDQRIALPALACHYEKLSEYHQLDPVSIARDYLAKVIHLPIRLQVPDNLSVARYLAHIWKDDQFLTKINDEMKIISGVQAKLDSDSHQEKHKMSEESELDGEPGEFLADTISDINSMDVKAALLPEMDDVGTDVQHVEEIPGFGPEQKDAFYRWLLKFNLRNPRQIKRLYNSYNLLWSLFDDNWRLEGKVYFPHMLTLLVLEMINESMCR